MNSPRSEGGRNGGETETGYVCVCVCVQGGERERVRGYRTEVSNYQVQDPFEKRGVRISCAKGILCKFGERRDCM